MLIHSQPDDNRSIISDIAGPEPERNFGEPYWAWILRSTVDTDGDQCILNADSDVWFALETYWTAKCPDKLADQGGFFDPPVEPDDEEDD